VIHYRNAARAKDVDSRALVTAAKRLLAAVGESDASLSLILVGDAEMREINREHRGKDRPTDVLSFALDGESPAAPRGRDDPERLLGDVVISVETARRQAADYDATLQEEIYRRLIHGLLHAIGHDHMRFGERRAMQREERRLAGAIGLGSEQTGH
jgi:probable rRNA maturation factor